MYEFLKVDTLPVILKLPNVTSPVAPVYGTSPVIEGISVVKAKVPVASGKVTVLFTLKVGGCNVKKNPELAKVKLLVVTLDVKVTAPLKVFAPVMVWVVAKVTYPAKLGMSLVRAIVPVAAGNV